ncbi:hypothetical protein BH23BAC4_BH23BAC4_00060 [soil metagenome]
MPFFKPATLLILAALFVAACGSEERVAQVTVENVQLQQEPSGDRVVSGFVRNHSERPARGVQLVVGLYDESNMSLGELQVHVGPVGPGEEMDFRQNVARDVSGASVRRYVVF